MHRIDDDILAKLAAFHDAGVDNLPIERSNELTDFLASSTERIDFCAMAAELLERRKQAAAQETAAQQEKPDRVDYHLLDMIVQCDDPESQQYLMARELKDHRDHEVARSVQLDQKEQMAEEVIAYCNQVHEGPWHWGGSPINDILLDDRNGAVLRAYLQHSTPIIQGDLGVKGFIAKARMLLPELAQAVLAAGMQRRQLEARAEAMATKAEQLEKSIQNAFDRLKKTEVTARRIAIDGKEIP